MVHFRQPPVPGGETRVHSGSILHGGGFTIVELSLVLVVVGLALAAALSIGFDSAEPRKRDETVKKLERIDRAIALYARREGQLPLADCIGATATCFDGIGDQAGPYIGVVPHVDLGLTRDDVTDGWGRLISYAVHDGATSGGALSCADPPASPALTAVNFEFAEVDAGGTDVVGNAPIAYAIFSHGLNGLGARTTSGSVIDAGGDTDQETANSSFGTVADTYRLYHGGDQGFDDMVRGRTPLQALCVAGCCGS